MSGILQASNSAVGQLDLDDANICLFYYGGFVYFKKAGSRFSIVSLIAWKVCQEGMSLVGPTSFGRYVSCIALLSLSVTASHCLADSLTLIVSRCLHDSLFFSAIWHWHWLGL